MLTSHLGTHRYHLSACLLTALIALFSIYGCVTKTESVLG